MDVGLCYLLALCIKEANAWHLRLTSDPPIPLWFIRNLSGATVLDQWKRDGFDATEGPDQSRGRMSHHFALAPLEAAKIIVPALGLMMGWGWRVEVDEFGTWEMFTREPYSLTFELDVADVPADLLALLTGRPT